VSDLPPVRLPGDGPPPPQRWAVKDPQAAARLAAARDQIAALSLRLSIPVENLMQPDLVRRVLWRPPEPDQLSEVLADGGARPWQIELVAPILAGAISGPAA
jgi:ribonuclease D